MNELRASKMPKRLQKRIVIVVSQFPEAHETFIVRELNEIVQRGIPIEIVSLKRCRDRIIYPEAKKLVPFVRYPGWKQRLASLFALLFFAVVHPLRFWSGIFLALRDNFRSPIYLAKCLAVIPRASLIAFRVRLQPRAIIHSHWATVPTFVAWFASRLGRRPYVFTAHAWDIFLHPGNLLRLINGAAAVITCTKYNRNYLHRLFPGKIRRPVHVIYHGLELERFRPDGGPKDPIFTVLAVGRLVPQKGFDVLIKACDLLSRRIDSFRCVIVGDGPEKGKLRDLAYSRNLEHLVQFTGALPHDQVLAWMQRAHVFAAPSVVAPNNDRDGIPNVILEAMAMRLPVVGSDISGIPEVVIPFVTGLLVPQKDATALCSAIELLYFRPDLRRRLGERARWHIENHFDIRLNAYKLIQVYEYVWKKELLR